MFYGVNVTAKVAPKITPGGLENPVLIIIVNTDHSPQNQVALTKYEEQASENELPGASEWRV